jgi:hypothetical protein
MGPMRRHAAAEGFMVELQKSWRRAGAGTTSSHRRARFALNASDAVARPGHRIASTFRAPQMGKQRWPSGPRWNPGGHARSYPLLGQQRCPSGPRCQPTGHTRLVAKGWQKPLGPRHHPGPQSSAALAVGAKLPAPATAATNTAFKMKVLSMLISSNQLSSQDR